MSDIWLSFQGLVHHGWLLGPIPWSKAKIQGIEQYNLLYMLQKSHALGFGPSHKSHFPLYVPK
jgi:hypothetical protein